MLTWVSSIFLLGPSERRETIEITISKQLFGIRETRFQVILTKFDILTAESQALYPGEILSAPYLDYA